jgi:ligand-binding SRPBCC domain-containing protein
MPFIHLTTFIAAPGERVVDLSRSVELHRASMKNYGEKIINGKIAGLMETGDSVTWEARHLFKKRFLKTIVKEMKRPEYFIDEQVTGDFVMMKHEHYFKVVENGTLMIDQFHFESPYGSFGRLINNIYLKKYMQKLLESRNEMIKQVAEGNQWKQYLT